MRIFVSLQMGWIEVDREYSAWNKAGMYGVKRIDDSNPTSEHGSITLDSDLFVDTTKDFGVYVTNDPQLLEKELAQGWYAIRFRSTDNNNLYVTPDQLYTIVEIVDNHTLRLQTHDVDNNPVAWSAPATASDLVSDLTWTHMHLKIEIPSNNS